MLNFRNNWVPHGTGHLVNLGALCMGLAVGWPTPSFAYLYSKIDGQARHDYLDGEWIESTINVGASVGSLASIFIADIYGRRISFYLSAVVLTVFWIFLGSSGVDKILVISAAGVAGIGVGVFSTTAVIYVTEISSTENRNLVGFLVVWCGYLGIFVMQVLGHFIKITVILDLMVILSICFVVTVHWFVIESPYYYYQTGAELDAKISLKILRNCKNILEIDEEYKRIEAFFNRSSSKSPRKLLFESMCPKTFRPVTRIALPLLCLSQMLGALAITDYAEKLIEIEIYATSGKLVTSFIDSISIVLCLFAIDRFGCKPLLIFTIIGSGACCLILAVFNFTNKENCYLKPLLLDHKIVNITMLSVYLAIYALGFIPVLPIVTSEIFPCQVKAAIVGISTSTIFLISFSISLAYKWLIKSTSVCSAFAYFTMLGSVCLPFALAILPASKNKRLLKIHNESDTLEIISKMNEQVTGFSIIPY